jgi:hypothetical protein
MLELMQKTMNFLLHSSEEMTRRRGHDAMCT